MFYFRISLLFACYTSQDQAMDHQGAEKYEQRIQEAIILKRVDKLHRLLAKTNENIKKHLKDEAKFYCSAILHHGSGSTALLKELSNAGFSLEQRNPSPDGDYPVHYAVNASYSVLELLLKLGANANVRNNYGVTPLHRVVDSNNRFESYYRPTEQLVDLLIAHKAIVNAQLPSGETALHIAAGNHNISIEVIKTLLKHKADPNMRNGNNMTPYDFARNNNRLEAAALLASLTQSTLSKKINFWCICL